MKYILVLIAIIVGIFIYYLKIKEKKSTSKKGNKKILENNNFSNNKPVIKVEKLPIEKVENCKTMFEIKQR